MKAHPFFESQSFSPLFIFLLALSLRILHLIASTAILPYEFKLNDGVFFNAFAEALARGELASAFPVVGLAPAYVGFLYFFQKLIGPDLIWPRIAQLFVGALACVGLQQMTKNIFGIRAGWIAGLFAAFCGIFIYFDMILTKASFVNSLMVFVFWALHKNFTKSSLVLWGLAGAALITASTVRMQLLITVPWIAGFLIWQAWKRRDVAFGKGVCFFLLMLMITPMLWMGWFGAKMNQTRGVPSTHEITAPQSGIHFYIGNHAKANGTYFPVPEIQATAIGHVIDARNVAEQTLGRPLNVDEINHFWLMRGWQSIRDNPWRWLKLEGGKLFLIWNAYEIPNNPNYDFWRKYSWVLSLPLVSYGWLAPLALLGWFFTSKDKRPMVLLLKGFAVSYIFSLLAIFVTCEYRVPLHLIWIVFAACAIDQLWGNIENGNKFALRKNGTLFLLFFIFCNIGTYLNKLDYDASMKTRFDSALSQQSPPSTPRSSWCIKKQDGGYSCYQQETDLSRSPEKVPGMDSSPQANGTFH